MSIADPSESGSSMVARHAVAALPSPESDKAMQGAGRAGDKGGVMAAAPIAGTNRPQQIFYAKNGFAYLPNPQGWGEPVKLGLLNDPKVVHLVREQGLKAKIYLPGRPLPVVPRPVPVAPLQGAGGSPTQAPDYVHHPELSPHNIKVDVDLCEQQIAALREEVRKFFDNPLRNLLDPFAPAPPKLTELDEAQRLLGESRKALADGDAQQARRLADAADHTFRAGQTSFGRYRDGHYDRLEATQHGLEYVRDGAKYAVMGLGVVTGAGAIALAGTTAIDMTDTAARVASGDKVDWGNIAADAAVTIIASRIGGNSGKLVNGLMSALTKNPAAQSIAKPVLEKAVRGVVTGLLNGAKIRTLSTAIHALQRSLAGQQITAEEFAAQLASNLSDPKSILIDLALGALHEGVQARADAKAGTAPSVPHDNNGSKTGASDERTSEQTRYAGRASSSRPIPPHVVKALQELGLSTDRAPTAEELWRAVRQRRFENHPDRKGDQGKYNAIDGYEALVRGHFDLSGGGPDPARQPAPTPPAASHEAGPDTGTAARDDHQPAQPEASSATSSPAEQPRPAAILRVADLHQATTERPVVTEKPWIDFRTGEPGERETPAPMAVHADGGAVAESTVQAPDEIIHGPMPAAGTQQPARSPRDEAVAAQLGQRAAKAERDAALVIVDGKTQSLGEVERAADDAARMQRDAWNELNAAEKHGDADLEPLRDAYRLANEKHQMARRHYHDALRDPRVAPLHDRYLEATDKWKAAEEAYDDAIREAQPAIDKRGIAAFKKADQEVQAAQAAFDAAHGEELQRLARVRESAVHDAIAAREALTDARVKDRQRTPETEEGVKDKSKALEAALATGREANKALVAATTAADESPAGRALEEAEDRRRQILKQGAVPAAAPQVESERAGVRVEAGSTRPMVRPRHVLLVSEDLKDAALRLMVPPQWEHATIIVGHSNPEYVAGLEGERAVKFIQAYAKPGQPIIFATCSSAAGSIPTGAAGHPYVVSYSQIVVVLSRSYGRYQAGQIVTLKPRPDVLPRIQRGSPPKHLPPGQQVSYLQVNIFDRDAFVILPDNLVVVGEPGRSKVYEITDPAAARKTNLGIVGNFETHEANIAFEKARIAGEDAALARRGGEPLARLSADVSDALRDVNIAKAEWFLARRDGKLTNAQLQKAEAAQQRLAEKTRVFAEAVDAAGDRGAYKDVLRSIDAVNKETAQWVDDARSPPRPEFVELIDPAAEPERGVLRQIWRSLWMREHGPAEPAANHLPSETLPSGLISPPVGPRATEPLGPSAAAPELAPVERATTPVHEPIVKNPPSLASPTISEGPRRRAGFELPHQGQVSSPAERAPLNPIGFDTASKATPSLERMQYELSQVEGRLPEAIAASEATAAGKARAASEAKVAQALQERSIAEGALLRAPQSSDSNAIETARRNLQQKEAALEAAEQEFDEAYAVWVKTPEFENVTRLSQEHEALSQRIEAEAARPKAPIGFRLSDENVPRLPGPSENEPTDFPPIARPATIHVPRGSGQITTDPIIDPIYDPILDVQITPSKVGFREVEDQFFGGFAGRPRILNEKLREGTIRLGIPGEGEEPTGGMAIQYNKRGFPVTVAEHLTQERVEQADTNGRPQMKFKLDPTAHAGQTGVDHRMDEVTDRFDHGHVGPSGTGATLADKINTFRHVNIVAQDKWQNETVWRGIEHAVKQLARDGHDLYVVTGPAFIGARIKAIPQAGKPPLLVPTHMWKAVYDHSTGQAAVYWSENGLPHDENGRQLSRREAEADNFAKSYEVLSVAEFTELSGVDPFPELDPAIKNPRMKDLWELPPPEPAERGVRRVPIQSRLRNVDNPVELV